MQRQTIVGAGIVLVGVLIVAIFLLPAYLADWLWYESVGRTDVFSTLLKLRIGLFVAGALCFGVLYFGSMWLARRIVARQAQAANEPFLTESAKRTDRTVRVITGVIGVSAAIVFGLLAAAEWNTLLRYQHAVPFGAAEPVHNKDVSFYVFTLPLWEFIQTWSFRVLIVVLVATLFAYGFRLVLPYMVAPYDEEGERREIPTKLFISGPIRAHLAVIGALILGTIAWYHWLERYDLLFSTRGAAYGASYVDVNVVQPVLQLLVYLALLAAFSLLAAAFVNNGILPAVGMGLWLAVYVVGSWAYPSLIHRVNVQPNELALERPYIQRNIQFTREAYGLHRIREMEHPGGEAVAPQEVIDNPLTVRNFRLWDPAPLLITYNQVQSIRPYYDFVSVGIDRYVLNNEYRQVMVSARELTPQRLPATAQTWVNRRLVFTHGYGIVMSPVNEVSVEGLPRFFLKDVPPSGALRVTRPEIYFGQMTNWYVITNTGVPEFDYPQGDQNVYSTYQANTGVNIGSLGRRLLFSWYLRDPNIMLSNEIRPESQLLYRRNITQRVAAIAPFLAFMDDPYIVVADGHLYWIIEGYTYTSRYPYSQPIGPFNYLRNSVKATVNAYDGTVNFYVFEPDDPILRAYARAFPGLFQPMAAMPEALRSHTRYPAFLFQVQAQLYSVYHMQQTDVFYNKEDMLSIPREIAFQGEPEPVQPYYVIMRLPQFEREEFILIMPYTPRGKDNMVAWLAARSDPEGYGHLFAFKYPKDRLIFGPMQIEARVDQTPEISQQFTLWNQAGSRVIRGNLLVVPIGNSNLYVEPIYLRSVQGQLPELKRVIIANGSQVVMAENVAEALTRLFGPEAAAVVTSERVETQTAVSQPRTTTQPQPTPAPAQPAPAPAVAVTPALPPASAELRDLATTLHALRRQNEQLQQELARTNRILEQMQQLLEERLRSQAP